MFEKDSDTSISEQWKDEAYHLIDCYPNATVYYLHHQETDEFARYRLGVLRDVLIFLNYTKIKICEGDSDSLVFTMECPLGSALLQEPTDVIQCSEIKESLRQVFENQNALS